MTVDHPDWFGAGEDESGDSDDRRSVDFDPEGADWFDDIDHVDPTPEEAPWTGSGPSTGADATAPAGAGGGGASGGAGAAGATSTNANASGRTEDGGPGGQDTAGTDRATGPAGGSGGESSQPAASSRGGRRRSQQDDSSGGFLAWLKRLLGLN